MGQRRDLEEKRMLETHSYLLWLQEKPSPTHQTPPIPHLTHVFLFGSYSFFRLFRRDGCFGLCFICTFIRRLWGLISWAVWDLEMKEVDDSSLATENRWPHPLDTAYFQPYCPVMWYRYITGLEVIKLAKATKQTQKWTLFYSIFNIHMYTKHIPLSKATYENPIIFAK